MIEYLLTKRGKLVIHNKTGANLRNGIVGTFITQYSHGNYKKNCYAVFEVDEAEFPNIVQQLSPNVIVLLNLFRDQLDRYGEVNIISEKWKHALSGVSGQTHIVVNADDPALSFICENFHGKSINYFGLSDDHARRNKSTDNWADSLYCMQCRSKLLYHEKFFSHLGDWYCTGCKRSRKKLDVHGGAIPLSLSGRYNQYNAAAALLTAEVLNLSGGRGDLKDFLPAFGRQEEFRIGNRVIKIFLSKNPTGFNESIRTVLALQHNPNILLALNDRIPDGTDVSWIWDVDFENLMKKARHVVCTGDRVGDMGVRIKYAHQTVGNHTPVIIEKDIQKAIEIGIQKTNAAEPLYVLPTYSAMLNIRKILGGRKIL